MESDLSVGNLANLVGLMKAHCVLLILISMAKDVAVQFSVAVVAAELVTLMMVALAEDLPKLSLKAATVVELESQWFAQPMKISMEDSAIQNAKLVTLESVQSAGKTALETPLMLEQHALRNPMAELLESQ